jgi:hypothetical protein
MGDKVRKLSDAIRLGAAIHPQYFNNLFGWQFTQSGNPDQMEVSRTCALGAAMVGIGKMPENFLASVKQPSLDLLNTRWPCLNYDEPCPSCDGDSKWAANHNLQSIIVHLNDGHKWSREKIANWLEGLGL